MINCAAFVAKIQEVVFPNHSTLELSQSVENYTQDEMPQVIRPFEYPLYKLVFGEGKDSHTIFYGLDTQLRQADISYKLHWFVSSCGTHGSGETLEEAISNRESHRQSEIEELEVERAARRVRHD